MPYLKKIQKIYKSRDRLNNKHDCNLMMSAKLATLGLLKIKVFWKGYDVIILVHAVTNKILSRESNYIVDVLIWPKFCNSSISMREFIINWIL